MKVIDEGTTRTVYEFDNSVVKIPKLNLMKNFKDFIILCKIRELTDIGKIIDYLLIGFLTNRNEGKRNRQIEKYVAKTKSYVFGLVIVQEKLEICDFGALKPLDNLYYNFSYEVKMDLAHAFGESHNFGYDKEGNIKMCDYGSDAVIKILTNHGDEVIENYKTSLELSKKK